MFSLSQLLSEFSTAVREKRNSVLSVDEQKMAELRRPESYSPKSSPRGSRSPVVPRQDSTGTLKTTISLGKTPAIVHSGPFYLMKEPPASAVVTGATNLMNYYNLEHAYNKFCGRKLKDQLSAFLPNLPGNIDGPGNIDNSSLKSLIEKPPIGGKELLPLTGSQLSGFRLHPGPLPEQYRLMSQQPQKKKHKHKKHKHKAGDAVTPDSQQESNVEGPHEKKHKKQKRHDEEKEKKKKKKEKKKKKKHVPELPTGAPSTAPTTALPHANGTSKPI